MKYISTLIVAIAIMAVGTVNAQTASKLNGQSFTYLMKNADGTGEEIIDQVTFGKGTVTSGHLGKAGYATGKVAERNAGATSDFDLTFTKPNGTTYTYSGKAEGVTFYGTINVVDANGTTTPMIFRGMITEEWNHMAAEREAVNKARHGYVTAFFHAIYFSAEPEFSSHSFKNFAIRTFPLSVINRML